MKYTEILNRRLKKAGREYRTGNHSDKKERLWNAIQEIMEEAEGTGSFLPWTQAVQKLKLNEQQQMLIAVLWGTETYGDRLSVEEFRRLWIQIYEEEPENMKALPVWYYFNEEYVELCPVLSGWLEGTMPVLPSGVKLRLTEEKKSYGLEELLAESHRIFSLAEQTGEAMILCLTGAAGSGREYAMEQICAGQNLALLLIDGETFRGTERELNACILSAMLYEAYPCVWLGKTERWELLEKMRESFSFYGVIREEGRALATPRSFRDHEKTGAAGPETQAADDRRIAGRSGGSAAGGHQSCTSGRTAASYGRLSQIPEDYTDRAPGGQLP